MGRRKSSAPKRNLSSDKTLSRRELVRRYRFLRDPNVDSAEQERSGGALTTAVLPVTDRSVARILPIFAEHLRDLFPKLRDEYRQRRDEQDDNGWYKGYREINGRRLEIKLLDSEVVTEWFGDELPARVVRYAERTARTDPRLVALGGRDAALRFTEWSVIASKQCAAQETHVDVPETNLQFGLILENGSDGTRVLDRRVGPAAPADLARTLWRDAPVETRAALAAGRDDDDDARPRDPAGRVARVLDAYGPLLRPRADLEQRVRPAEDAGLRVDGGPPGRRLRAGEMICTSGGVPHAGPACRDFRAVVFGAVSPLSDDLYDVDDQYLAHSAVLFVIQALWDTSSADSKRWLLLKLCDTVRDYGDTSTIHNNRFVSSHFTKFMRDVVEEVVRDEEEEDEDETFTLQGDDDTTATNSKTKDPKDVKAERLVDAFLSEHGNACMTDLFQFNTLGMYEREFRQAAARAVEQGDVVVADPCASSSSSSSSTSSIATTTTATTSTSPPPQHISSSNHLSNAVTPPSSNDVSTTSTALSRSTNVRAFPDNAPSSSLLSEDVSSSNRKRRRIDVRDEDKVAGTTTTATSSAGDTNDRRPLPDNVPSVVVEGSVMYALKPVGSPDSSVDYREDDPGTNAGLFHDTTYCSR